MSPEPHDAKVRDSGAKPRRPHKKSRVGCVDCRRRRVKCSEERPQCRACVRRGAECQYPSAQPASLSARLPPPSPDHNTTSPKSISTTSSSQPADILPLPPLSSITCPNLFRAGSQQQSSVTFGIQDMAILHHFTISTSLDIYQNSGLSVSCQVLMPQIAFKHPFVMQALLGLASLHLAYLDPPDRIRHIADAVRYHTQGLQGFNEAICTLDSDIANALFVWSVLNLLYVLGISGRLGNDLGYQSAWGSRKDRILGVGWIPMIRGTEAVIQSTYATISSGPLRQLLVLGNWDEIDPDKVTDPEDQRFCNLRSTWESSSDAQIYDKALWALRRCRMFMAQYATEALKETEFNRTWQGPFLFIPFTPQEYFTLLHQRQPPALILYAFFGALLHSLNDTWFLEGWGHDIVEVVSDLLGSYWKPWIAWPLEIVGLHHGQF